MEKLVDKDTRSLGFLLATTLVLLLFAAPMPASAEDDDEEFGSGAKSIERAIQRGRGRIAFEVAENGAKFVFDESPLDINGLPIYGNPFITQGFIYPVGTLDPNDPTRDGVIPIMGDAGGVVDAAPEFPDLLLGIWICYGTVFAQEGFNIQSGPTVISTQLYDFKEVSGDISKISLTSNGLELIDLDTPVQRALIGGTGPFRKARGQITQKFIGVNETGGFTLRFDTDMK